MTPTAFRISLGANLVLIGVVAALLWRDRPAAPSSSPQGQPASAPSEAPKPDAAANDPEAKSPVSHGTRAAVAQLEQMGLSREVIVNALLGDFHHRWDTRFTQLEKRYAPRQVPEREYIELGRLRDAAQVQELKEALGDDGYLAWDMERTLRVMNMGGVHLTPEEAGQAYRLQKEFDEQYKDRQMAMEDGVADAADLSTIDAQAREALGRELETLLGKRRFDAMRGITDPIADVYRMYGDLTPRPDQAQAVLRAQEEYRAREAALAGRLNEDGVDTQSLSAELQAIGEAREENLRQIFGAEAYDTMKRQNDPTYKRLTQFAEAWELKDHEIQSVYEPLRAFQDQAERTRTAAAMSEAAGQPVNWREINAAIEQTRQQTEAGLEALIGGQRLWRLKQDGILTIR